MNDLVVGLAIAYIVGSFTWCLKVEKRLTRIEQKLEDLCRWFLTFVYNFEEEKDGGDSKKDLSE